MEPEHHAVAYAQCACVLFTGKMANRMYGHPREGVLELCNGAVSEKTPQIFRPMLPAKYAAPFSGRTEAPEVRCRLTDRQTHTQTRQLL